MINYVLSFNSKNEFDRRGDNCQLRCWLQK